MCISGKKKDVILNFRSAIIIKRLLFPLNHILPCKIQQMLYCTQFYSKPRLFHTFLNYREGCCIYHEPYVIIDKLKTN